MSRRTKYSEDVLELARYYVEMGWQVEGDPWPMVEGLALTLDVSRATCYDWANDPDKSEFRHIMERLGAQQGREAVSGGAKNRYNAQIVRLVLSTNHGYVERTHSAVTSPDGSMTPQVNIDAEMVERLAAKLVGDD